VLSKIFETKVLSKIFETRVLSKIFETRVLSKIFGPQSEGVTGDRRKLHTEKLHDLYSPNITRVISKF